MSKRFETKAEAFEYSVTEGGLIFGYGFWTRSDYIVTDFYVVPLSSLEWAERTGMQIVTDFSDIS
jgi:hypothetical protein